MMKIDHLPEDTQMRLVELLSEAVACRLAQWDAEREMERILDRELDLDVAALAAVIDPDQVTSEVLKTELEDL